MNWKQQWINQVLAKIPMGSYRKRTETELFDHLETQYCTLIEAGRTESDARTETLRTMGEPKALQEEYWAAWRRSLPGRLESLGRRLYVWVCGCGIIGGLYILTLILLELAGFTYDAAFMNRVSFPLLSGTVYIIYNDIQQHSVSAPLRLGSVVFTLLLPQGAPPGRVGNSRTVGGVGRGKGSNYRAVRADLPDASEPGAAHTHLSRGRHHRAVVLAD